MKLLSRHKMVVVLTLTVMASTWMQHSAQAAQTTASIFQTVTSAISISKLSDLIFGEAVQGTAAVTVAAGNAEDASNASFLVTGQPNTAYNIQLPANGTVKLTNGAGGTPETEIAINGFQSFPAAAGTLSGGGTQNLFVGATREGLLATQTTGNYVGTFTVTVAY
jgi:spore coat protein U-like protein